MKTSHGAVLFGVTIDYQLRYHAGLPEALAQEGYEVHVVSGDGPTLQELSQVPGITTHVLPMARKPSPHADLKALYRWGALLRRVRPRVVLIGTPKASLLGILAAAFARVPARIYELHGLRLESASGVGRRVLAAMEWITCRCATEVIAVSQSLADVAIAEGVVRPGSVGVLGAGSPGGVDIDRFSLARADLSGRVRTREEWDIPADAAVVAFIGRLTADKGLNELAGAIAVLAAQRSVHLLVVGSVDDESGRIGVERLRATGVPVSFTGEVAQIDEYLAVSDVLCFPTKREGLPTVVLEAFAARVPVVAMRATGVVDLVVNEETGMLVEQNDAEGLALALERVLEETDLRERVVQAAFELADSAYRRSDVQGRWKRKLVTLARTSPSSADASRPTRRGMKDGGEP